ncbi:MAG: hypothetical protein LBU05_00355, partial [Bifidobacteriaceae bacterium]|nr:hypothetical protein [Bifidobacteriaceae bacterium]
LACVGGVCGEQGCLIDYAGEDLWELRTSAFDPDRELDWCELRLFAQGFQMVRYDQDDADGTDLYHPPSQLGLVC